MMSDIKPQQLRRFSSSVLHIVDIIGSSGVLLIYNNTISTVLASRRLPTGVNSQVAHGNGFSPVWTLMWWFRSLLVKKHLVHILHWNGFWSE
ncbi:hypothetical protein ILYODFUR_009477 [Ilyodon furcidens]|uniref:Uncharacterized protein n=1 Tax=Ilyodon furcidens TaxID=33524 RepID=A0ABV0SWZ9_9TELE